MPLVFISQNQLRFQLVNRSVVVRLSFFGVNNIKDGHLDWYKKMLQANRAK